MNKNAIQKFAIWARNELIEQVRQRAYQYGITDKGYGEENASVISGRVLSADEKRQRRSFVEEIKKQGFQQAVEEVAYTWFNRFVALRYMEVNDFLPTHIRVLSDANGNFNPEILKDVLHLDLEGLDKGKVSELLNANKTEELYRYLLLTQCNALNALLPEMFERLGAYTEMLLPNNILKPEGILGRLVSDIIPEDTWRDGVQIIGWLYQYYNTEPKQEVFDGLKKNIKITKEKIPAATQLFTPDWIVRYMVENSLGRLWLESHPNNTLKANWKYYLDEAEQTPDVAAKLKELREKNAIKTPEDIKLIDPCMGSGHILVYAFDVLMQIYTSEGYSERDAAKLILEKNIYGLDIDRRAYQLAYFALMMKARQYSRRILTEGVKPQVYHPAGFPDGEEYGSLVREEPPAAAAAPPFCESGAGDVMPEPPKPGEQITIWQNYESTLNTRNFRRLLAQKYDVVITNPPYMGGSGMSAKLAEYVKKHYPDSKSDLFAVFIEKCGELLKPTGYQAMITQHAWMFLSSYEKLRIKLLATHDIVNMAHLGARAFEEIGGEVVQTTAFVLNARKTPGYLGNYARLVDFSSQSDKEAAFLSGDNRHSASADNFAKIPGSPVAYWVSAAMLRAFDSKFVGELYDVKSGLSTGDNNIFVRDWFEIDWKNTTLKSGAKVGWVPYNKGGGTRKWYGLNSDVVNWGNNGDKIKRFGKGVFRNPSYYFREGLTWSGIATVCGTFRVSPSGFIFDSNKGPMIFEKETPSLYLLGLLNSAITPKIIAFLNPSLSLQIGDLVSVPFIMDNARLALVEQLVTANIVLSRADWDAFETSWDFKRHPLV